MSDESKMREIKNHFEQAPDGWRVVATPLQRGGYAPYCFQVVKDADSIAVIFIQRIFWDDGTVLAKFLEYDLVNYIRQNAGQQIMVTTSGLQNEGS